MKKLLIVFGSNSKEHNISCKSTKSILKNIDKKKYDIKLCGIDLNNEWYIYKDDFDKLDENWINKNIEKVENTINLCKNFDLVLPIIHGKNGEDGKIQGFFDMFNINYIGCNQLSSIIAYDKYLTKIYVEKLNIPQLPYILIGVNDNIKNIDLDLPVIVKPSKGGSSIGISVVNKKRELKNAIKNALKYDDKIIIEKYIESRELECAVLNGKKLIISEVGEVLKEKQFYDFDSKYISKNKTIIANIPNNIKNLIKYYSKQIFIKMGCADLSRIDFLYDEKNNEIYFNEINTMPGFTDISMYPSLINNSKIDFKELLNIIINNH